MPSPKPRPPKLRLLNGRHAGVDSGGRKVEDGPAFRRLPPEQPPGLSAEAIEHWELVAPELMRLELTKPIDAGSLGALCETYARLRRAQSLLNDLTDGELYGPHGRHPAFVTVEAASREYRAWASEFGLTPSSEGRLGVKEANGAGANPFAGSATLP